MSAAKESLRKEVYEIRNYKNLQFLWLNKKVNHVTLSLLLLNNGMEYTKDSSKAGAAGRAVTYSQTAGGRLEFRKDILGVNLEGYYQGGKDEVHHSLSAYDLIAEATVKPGKWQVTLGTELLSGTSAATATLQTVTGGDKNKLSTWGWLAFNITPTFFHIKK